MSRRRTKVGFGCGCGHTNLLSSNRPVNGSPLADLVKSSMVGTGTNHVGAANILGINPRGGGGLGAVSKNIAMSILRRGR